MATMSKYQLRNGSGLADEANAAHTPWSDPMASEHAEEIDASIERLGAVDTMASIRDVLELYHRAAMGVDGVFVLTVIDPISGKVRPQQFAIGDVDGMAAEAVARGQHANVYFAPVVLRKDMMRGRRGTAQDAVAVLGGVIDDDGDTGKRAVLPPTIHPSVEITTSTKPALNRHHHFIFDRALLPAEAKTLADLLHRKCGGDHGTRDIAHVWRLPQTLNHPSKVKVEKRGRPAEPQLVELTGGTLQCIDPEALKHALESMPDLFKALADNPHGDDAAANRRSATREEILDRRPAWLRDLVDTSAEVGDRSSHCHHTMMALFEHGCTDDEVGTLAASGAFAAKFVSRGDIAEEIRRTRARWQAKGGKRVDSAALDFPDMSICRRNQIHAPRFPLEVLGPAADWVKATAECKNAPLDYVALGLLVTTAGVIGAKRRISPWSGWHEPSILWGVLVGPPSVNKSPATDPCREAAREIESGDNADWHARQAEFETAKKVAETRRVAWNEEVKAARKSGKETPSMPVDAIEPKAPTKHRLLIVDATTEKVARMLGENPRGLLCFRDELAGLLGGFDRYGGSGSDRAFWNEAFGGRPYRYDRVNLMDGTVDIPFCAVSLLGALQPDRLNTMLLKGDDDGLASRPLYAWPDPVTPHRPNQAANNHTLLAALLQLASLPWSDEVELRPRTIQLEPDAVGAFNAWWSGAQWIAKQAATGRLAGAIGKLDGTVLRLALVLELIGWAWRQNNHPEPQHISLQSVLGAILLADAWVRPNLERVFAEASIPQAQRDAMTVGLWLLKTKPEVINSRDLRRQQGFPGPREPKALDAAIEVLVDARWLRQPPSDGPGRPRKDFAVNPAIFGSA
jgi:hypothetical protein